MKKATHIGECQACGRTQMLPGDRLSLHGYQVKWSCFIGTCPGSEELPFEQDKRIVETSIANTIPQRDRLIDLAVELETCDPQDTRVWVSERNLKDLYAKSANVVRVLEVFPNYVRVDFGGMSRVGYTDPEGKVRGVSSHDVEYGLEGEVLLHAYVRALNNKEAKSIRHRAQQLTDYIKWQQGRLKGWAPKPLKKRPAK